VDDHHFRPNLHTHDHHFGYITKFLKQTLVETHGRNVMKVAESFGNIEKHQGTTEDNWKL